LKFDDAALNLLFFLLEQVVFSCRNWRNRTPFDEKLYIASKSEQRAGDIKTSI
jgi:hypothetical protein